MTCSEKHMQEGSEVKSLEKQRGADVHLPFCGRAHKLHLARVEIVTTHTICHAGWLIKHV